MTHPHPQVRELVERRRAREATRAAQREARDARPRRLRLAGAVALGLVLGLLLGAGLEAWAVYAGVLVLPVAP